MIEHIVSGALWPSAGLVLQASTVAALAVVCAYKYATYHYGRWKELGVPYAEPTPLFGNFRDVIMGRLPLVELVHSLYRRYDGQRYFGVFEGRNPVLVLRDPVLVHTAMVGDFAHFYDRIGGNTSFKHENLFEHLFNMRGQQWKSTRAKLSPTFTSAKLKFMLADIHGCTARLMDNLNAQIADNDGIVDVSESAAQYTTDTIGRCAFGLDFNALSNPNSEFRRVGRDIFTPTRRTILFNSLRLTGFGWLLDVFRVRSFGDHIYDFFDNLLETSMERHRTGQNTRNDFVSLLVKLKDDENQSNQENKLFTDNILAANTFIFFIAGFETTASTISYCLYELAMNPEIQNKLRNKIKKTQDENEGQLSYDTLKEMKYLDMVINETLRMHPPVPVLNRVCTKKYTFPDSNVTLDIGDKLIIPIYPLHYDPKYFPNPEVFDPERFTEENKASRPDGTFIPFGDGPRICIGLRFAIMEIKTGLAEILSKFEVKVCKNTQIPIKVKPRSFLLTPEESIRLTLKVNVE